MSLKNQMLIVNKIKSIDQNFIPSIQVDSRASPDERELQFMAEVVIAVNNLKNVRNVNKIFFNRQVKVYSHFGPRQQCIRSYRDGSIELYVNLHHHDLNIERTLSCITSERNQEFIRTRQSYENVNFVKAEVNEVVKAEVKEEIIVKEIAVKEIKEIVKEVKEIEMNDEKITIQESVFGYDDVCGDDGESWINFPPAKTEDDEEEVSMNVAVNDEVKDEVMTVAETEVKYELVNEEDIPERYAEYAVNQVINSEDVFFEDVDFDLATKMIVDHCTKQDVNVSSEVIREKLIEKVKVACHFGKVPNNDEPHHYKIYGSEFDDGYSVFYIERDSDDLYSIPQRFIPNQEFEVYSFKKYEELFESFFDADDRFEYVGIVSTQMYEFENNHFVEHRSLMSRFFSDEEILSSKPTDEKLTDEEYIEWARSNDCDRIDRFVVAIKEIIL